MLYTYMYIYSILFLVCYVWDDTHMTSMKIVQFSRPPNPLVHLRPTFFNPLDLGRPISNKSSLSK